jgi:hypothetical protein
MYCIESNEMKFLTITLVFGLSVAGVATAAKPSITQKSPTTQDVNVCFAEANLSVGSKARIAKGSCIKAFQAVTLQCDKEAQALPAELQEDYLQTCWPTFSTKSLPEPLRICLESARKLAASAQVSSFRQCVAQTQMDR